MFRFAAILRLPKVCRFFVRNLKRTALYDLHKSLNAKFVNFAGFEMPIQYGDKGTIESHRHVRSACGIFDVSHMLQMYISGKDSKEFLLSKIVADLDGLAVNSGTLSLFTNEDGGIMDDLIVTNVGCNNYYVVSNAGCSEKIYDYLKKGEQNFVHLGKDVHLEISPNSLIAIQGPETSSVLKRCLGVDISHLKFMQSDIFDLGDHLSHCRITRCGYTGEDGVEISIESSIGSIRICETLLKSNDPDTIMVGLGARDTLRLEAGLCLYGNEIDETTTPVESGLSWTIGKIRRLPTYAPRFPGWEKIIGQITKEHPMTRRRVGLMYQKGLIARNGENIWNADSKMIGNVTSGCYSPSLDANIAMGYVDMTDSKISTLLRFNMRDRWQSCEICKIPFIKPKYFL